MKKPPMVIISFRVRKDQRARVIQASKRTGVDKSELYRRGLDEVIINAENLAAKGAK